MEAAAEMVALVETLAGPLAVLATFASAIIIDEWLSLQTGDADEDLPHRDPRRQGV